MKVELLVPMAWHNRDLARMAHNGPCWLAMVIEWYGCYHSAQEPYQGVKVELLRMSKAREITNKE